MSSSLFIMTAILEERPRVKITRIFNWKRRYLTRIYMFLFCTIFISICIYVRDLNATTSPGNDGYPPDLDFTPIQTRLNLSSSQFRLHDALSEEERVAFRSFFNTFPNTSWCPEVPYDQSNMDSDDSSSTDQFLDQSIKTGGWWQPIGCKARHTTAIVIPYRDREKHLHTLVMRLHQILQYQMISYRIFVVEQNGTGLFNKGALYNAAFHILNHHYSNYARECLVFHDVDLIPEDERNLYTCPHPSLHAVRHMSVAVDKMKYQLPYPELVGGVLACPSSILQLVNGYSNMYRGWGGEDDDMWYRLEAEGIRVLRPPTVIGRYKMLPHPGRPMAVNRYRLLRSTKKRYKNDGIEQMVQWRTYNIVSIIEYEAYTHLLVSVNGANLDRFPFVWCFLCTALFHVRRFTYSDDYA